VAIFGSTSAPNAAPDFDGDSDGADNELEWLTGTNPENPASVWRIGIEGAGETVHLEFERIAGRGFEVQFRTNLVSGEAWRVLDSPANQPVYGSVSVPAVVTDAITNAPSRFYRVRVFGQ
jgi:hypothetical protein